MNNLQNKNNIANEIWLNYFNDVLYNKGTITENKRNKMKHLIHDRCNNLSARDKKVKLF